MPTQSYSIRGAAEATRTSRETIKRRLASGAFPNATLASEPGTQRQSWRIDASDLRAAGFDLSDAVAPQPCESEAESLRLALARSQGRIEALERALEILERALTHKEQ